MLHEPLDPTQKQFRLVRLRPRNQTALFAAREPLDYPPIECILYTTSLDRKPLYHALSYTWGQADDTLPVQINGQDVFVTRNLRVALESIREEKDEVVLWVDAICINQTDIKEKNAQVSQMRDIYANATQTIVWLGPATEYSGRFLAELNQIGQHTVDRGVRDMMLQMATSSEVVRSEKLERSVKKHMADYIENYYRHGARFRFLLTEFAHLLRRDYWTRVWIAQEFGVSLKLQIRCGRSTISFEYLQATYMFLLLVRREISDRLSKRLGMDDELDDKNATVLTSVFSLRGVDSSNTKGPGIFGLRQNYQDCQNAEPEVRVYRTNFAYLLSRFYTGGQASATDQRDKIYALLGMAGDVDALELRPEYDPAVACETVFTSAARAMLTAGHVDLLAYSQFSVDRGQKPPSEPAHGLPSWVPDWRVKILEPYAVRILTAPGAGEQFLASGKLVFHKPFSFQNGVPKERVKLLGFRIDVIEATTGEWGTESTIPDFERRRKYLSDVEELCRRSDAKKKETGVDVYPKPSDRQDAHALVPVAGQGLFGMCFQGRVTEAVYEGYNLTWGDIRTRARGDRPKFGVQPLNYYHIRMDSQHFRRPFLSAQGFVGLAPGTSLPGDLIVVFLGGKLPYVLRADGGLDGAYRFVGEAYVHGIMYGELSDTEPVVEEIMLK